MKKHEIYEQSVKAKAAQIESRRLSHRYMWIIALLTLVIFLISSTAYPAASTNNKPNAPAATPNATTTKTTTAEKAATPDENAATQANASNANPNPPLPTPVGRVVWVKGTLKAVMPNKEERVLQKTSVIYVKDTLITDPKSQAQIVFTDNSLMTFRPDTKFYIEKYNYNPQAKKGSVGKYFMRLLEGGFRTITGLIAKGNPSDYQINTPVATIGVRGTDYAVYFKAGEIFVGYYQGSPCVTSQDQTLCLSETTRYAMVPKTGAAPVPLSQQPDVFSEKQLIIPAKIAPFTGGGGGGTTTGPSQRSGGPISSFCITQ